MAKLYFYYAAMNAGKSTTLKMLTCYLPPTSGGASVNDTLMHFVVEDLPFGGVGPSGMGAYHGKFGFEEFSHRKSVLTKPTRPDLAAFIYPPYTEKAFKLARRLF